MEKRQYELIIGALLHDIGKVIYHAGNDHRKHGESGYDFLKDDVGISDQEILDAVRYHHAETLNNAEISKDANAYIVYMADSIASSVDRREKKSLDYEFSVSTILQPVFNILNGNKEKCYYSGNALNVSDEINYPTKEKSVFAEKQYQAIKEKLEDNLRGFDLNEGYINLLLETLETNFSFIPASTSVEEMPDISLYDHLKLTAGISSCIDQYLREKGISDYQTELFVNGKDFYDKEVFQLCTLDVSGIQKFIYTISTKNALRMLRARSFYLDMMMEHLIDELLGKEGLSRTNLIYAGGGHCYLLIPNTNMASDIFDRFLQETNEWFLENFGTALYIAGARAAASANSLKNIPDGSYSEIFRKLSSELSERKNSRYTAEQMKKLNHQKIDDYTRECSVCHNIGKVNENGRCRICEALEQFSKSVLYDDFFTVIEGEFEDKLPLPGGYSLIYNTEESLKNRLANEKYVRTYGKNRNAVGERIISKIWIGNYTTGETFGEFTKGAEGISRLGILRADVDNLGAAFIAGFKNPENHDRYVTLSRTAALSRQLSLFFRLHINKILKQADFTISGEKGRPRKATIVYSGGDDLFIVGAWNDIVELSLDIRRDFECYTEGTLSISGGIGLYTDTYPISASAREVETLVDKSKDYPGKNAITLLEDGIEHTVKDGESLINISDGTYSWKELEDNVIGDKFKVIQDYFSYVENSRGNSFLYHLLELIRNQKDRINFARFVYIIARMEPDDKSSKEEKEAYKIFEDHMVTWIQNEKDSRELKTAMELYVYLNREKREEDE